MPGGLLMTMISSSSKIISKAPRDVTLWRLDFWLFIEGNIELDAIAGSDEVVRFGSFPVKPHAIFTEELSDITDGKSFLKKIL